MQVGAFGKEKNYGELGKVKLTDTEYEKLKSKYPLERLEKRLKYLTGYIASKGAKYKNHYAVFKRIAGCGKSGHEQIHNAKS